MHPMAERGTAAEAAPEGQGSGPARRWPRHGGEPSRFAAAADLLKALASPHRVAIVDLLAAGPLRVHEIVEALGVDQPLVSQHLRVLRDADLLTSERHGKEVVYSLADEHIAHIVGDAITHAAEVAGGESS